MHSLHRASPGVQWRVQCQVARYGWRERQVGEIVASRAFGLGSSRISKADAAAKMMAYRESWVLKESPAPAGAPLYRRTARTRKETQAAFAGLFAVPTVDDRNLRRESHGRRNQPSVHSARVTIIVKAMAAWPSALGHHGALQRGNPAAGSTKGK